MLEKSTLFLYQYRGYKFIISVKKICKDLINHSKKISFAIEI